MAGLGCSPSRLVFRLCSALLHHPCSSGFFLETNREESTLVPLIQQPFSSYPACQVGDKQPQGDPFHCQVQGDPRNASRCPPGPTAQNTGWSRSVHTSVSTSRPSSSRLGGSPRWSLWPSVLPGERRDRALCRTPAPAATSSRDAPPPHLPSSSQRSRVRSWDAPFPKEETGAERQRPCPQALDVENMFLSVSL